MDFRSMKGLHITDLFGLKTECTSRAEMTKLYFILFFQLLVFLKDWETLKEQLVQGRKEQVNLFLFLHTLFLLTSKSDIDSQCLQSNKIPALQTKVLISKVERSTPWTNSLIFRKFVISTWKTKQNFKTTFNSLLNK